MKKFFSFVIAAMTALTMSAEAISVADAITAGMALDSAATSEATYTIEGYVVNAQPFSLSYNNQIWYMADDAANANNQEFQAYGCVAIEGADTLQVLNGDKVQLTGQLFKYWNKSASKYVIEVKNGTAAFVSKAEGDHSINKQTTAITVAKALEIAEGVAIGSTTSETYEITGYVTVMLGKETDFETYGNQTFWIADANNGAASNADGAFEVYRGKAPQAVKVGDLIMVKTAIKRYNDGSATGLVESETNAAVTILGGDVPPVEQADVVFTSADFNGQGVSGSGGQVTATKDGVTFTCDKAFGDQYGVRCYKNSHLNIASAEQQIGKIVFEFATVSGTYYNGGLDDEIVVNGMEFDAASLASQARMNSIKIYFGEYEKPVVEYDTITVAEAIDIAKALTPEKGKSAETDKKYAVKGFVVGISSTKTNTYYMADEAGAYGEFQAYQCANVDYTVAENDLVVVVGKIAHYYGEGASGEYHNYEISKGDLTHVYAEGIENIELTEKAQKVMVDGVMYIIRDNKMYNLQGTQVR